LVVFAPGLTRVKTLLKVSLGASQPGRNGHKGRFCERYNKDMITFMLKNVSSRAEGGRYDGNRRLSRSFVPLSPPCSRPLSQAGPARAAAAAAAASDPSAPASLEASPRPHLHIRARDRAEAVIVDNIIKLNNAHKEKRLTQTQTRKRAFRNAGAGERTFQDSASVRGATVWPCPCRCVSGRASGASDREGYRPAPMSAVGKER
jgi:hypothetical protein